MTPVLRRFYPDRLRKMHYNIGYWAWELDTFPEEWIKHLRFYDEVWTTSDFVTESIKTSCQASGMKIRTPVVTMPMGFDINFDHYRKAKSRFDLPKRTVVFLVLFDFQSSFHRKNPLGALEAFRFAFEGDSPDLPDVLLVIKCLVPRTHGFTFEQEFLELKQAVDKSRRVRLMTDALTTQKMHSLMASVDVLVSMHRSEGFGLPLLEMLMLGKPVIATAYSGNMDFMSKLPEEFQFLLIPYRYVGVNVSEPFKHIYRSDQRWADPDIEQAAKAMVMLASNQSLRDRCEAVVGPLFRETFGQWSVGMRMKARLRAIHGKPS